jgi:methane/ammonia monooxygenase subunit A
MAFVWPATFIAMGLVLDCTLVITRSFLLTGIFGGFAWACIFYPANWPLLAPFHQPIEWHGTLMSLADLQGYMYVRTGTPEYIRIIEEGTLRTFGEHVAPITVFFAAFVCILMYFVWNRFGALLAKTLWVKRL